MVWCICQWFSANQVFSIDHCIYVVWYFADAASPERQDLFVKKLQQCCNVFDFMDPVSDLRGKEVKRGTLNELVDYITSERGVLTEPVYPEIVRMVSQ